MGVYGNLRTWVRPRLRMIKSRRYARREAAQIARTDAPVVLVYQMAKVGSRTVYESLKESALEHPLFHVHYLQPHVLDAMERRMLSRGIRRHEVPYNMRLGRELARQIKRLAGRRKFKVITLVRDPIGRDVSSLMQHPHLWPHLFDDNGRLDVSGALSHLHNIFSQPSACWFADWWFANELEPSFQFDVLAHPFDKQRGYQIVRGEDRDVLILRVEDLDKMLSRALSEFFGCRPIPLVRANARTATSDAASYRELLRRLRIPATHCRRIYNRPLWRHFYTPAMHDAFVDRWSGGG